MPEDRSSTPARNAPRARLAALEAENARLGRELEAARGDVARFRAVLDSAADYAILTTDPDGRITSWNAGATNLLGWGEAEALGMDGRLVFTPEDRGRGDPEAEMALAAVEGRAGNERWIVRRDGSRFWGSGVLVPLRDAPAPGGFLKVMRDRTERREGDERQRVLLQELAHRVKNSLAVVLAMARRTGDRGGDLAGFLEGFEGRLLALAAAHDLVSEGGWLGVPLAALLRVVLAPHDGGGRVAVELRDDPTLTAAAAQSLAMALHELAANAARHGALSAPGGAVSLEARREGAELVIAWREAGGPPVAGSPAAGFGTELLGQLVAYQHGGRVELDWRPGGLACTVRLPLAEVTASTRRPSDGRVSG